MIERKGVYQYSINMKYKQGAGTEDGRYAYVCVCGSVLRFPSVTKETGQPLLPPPLWWNEHRRGNKRWKYTPLLLLSFYSSLHSTARPRSDVALSLPRLRCINLFDQPSRFKFLSFALTRAWRLKILDKWELISIVDDIWNICVM